MSIPAVPLRTPMYDAQGNLTRTWVSFFQTIGSTPGSGEYTVPIVGGVATPDASRSTNILTLTADTTVAAPLMPANSSGTDLPWSLIVRQDPDGGTGGWSTIFDASYYMTTAIATASSPTNTQCHVDFKSTPGGNTYLAGAPSIDQPIPPA